MKYNILIILIISLFINQLRAVNCPAGSQTADGATDVADVANIGNCNMCRANFFHGGNPAFAAGNAANGICTECPRRRTNPAPAPAQGGVATLANQCDVSCPSGSVIDNAGTANYVNLPNECINCATQHYAATPAEFQAGTTQCLPCPVNLAVGVVTAGNAANIATQCNVACPVGTQLQNGQQSYVNASSECSFCRSGFYFAGPGDFNAGTSVCTQCPAGSNKADGAAVAGQNALITAQCNVACPTGTVNATGASNWVQTSGDCVNCAPNYFYSGTAFVNGTTQCTPCQVNKDGGVATVGSSAKLSTQCKVACPSGTVLDDGTTSNYVNSSSECTKCAANYYQSKTTGIVAGTDGCTECTKKLTSGAQAKPLADANQKVQCASSSFAKFLSISLLFISFSLL